jgi:hypothetical protein
MVRFSIRPCPLSISQARSPSAARRAVGRGGKADLRRGEDGRDVGPQRGLVLRDRQHVVASSFDHRGAHITVREHGVAGDDFALHREHAQQFQRGFVLVGRGIHPQLAHDGSDIWGIGRHQVDPGRLAVAAAPGGFAVDGELGGVARPEPPLDPLADARLEVRDIDATEDPRLGGLAEAALPGEAQQWAELPAPLLAVLDDGLGAGHAREQGDDGQGEKGGERMPLALGAARIMNAFKEFHQRGVGFHARVRNRGLTRIIDHGT